MRILLITNVFPQPHQPNRGAFNFEMARGLAETHNVQVISPVAWVSESHVAKTTRRIFERRITRDGMTIHYPRYVYSPKVLRNWYGHFYWWSIRRTLREVFREFAPDVILGYWAHPDGEAAVRAARKIGVPCVVMVGGSDIHVLGRQPARRRLILRVLRSAAGVVTVSMNLKTRLGEFGLAGTKVHVVYRGVDTARFTVGNAELSRRALGLSDGGPHLLWVGHMMAVKGLDVLIKACGMMRSQGVDFHLHLLGDGSLRTALVEHARQLGLAEMVTFHGYVPHKDLPDWYRAADLTLLPSYSEGIPNVLLESMAAGTPFVASDVGGIPEIADARLDRLVPAGDAPALAEAIVQALRAPRDDHAGRLFQPWTMQASTAALVAVLEDARAAHEPAV